MTTHPPISDAARLSEEICARFDVFQKAGNILPQSRDNLKYLIQSCIDAAFIVEAVNAHAALIEELRKLAIVERVTSISSNDDNSWMHCKICGSQWGKFYGNTKEKHKADCVIYDALSPRPTKE